MNTTTINAVAEAIGLAFKAYGDSYSAFKHSAPINHMERAVLSVLATLGITVEG